MDDFELNLSALIDVALALKENVRIGLAEDHAQIKCLPTFIAPKRRLPDGPAYVLDLGGSNLRAAVVRFQDGKAHYVKGPLKMAMPWKRNSALPKDEFLELQAGLLASLQYEKKCPLGYCFSYPATSTINRDAVLLDWTKGIAVPHTRGKPIGEMLIRHVKQRHKELRISAVSVINDTVASLFAGLTRPEIDACIGLIVGTGTNMAAFMDAAFISKLSQGLNWKGQIPINLESGNFIPPHLTRYDDAVDAASENKGAQRFEKAASGLYLSRIFKSVFPDAKLDPDAGAKGLIRLYRDAGPCRTGEAAVAKSLYSRSAKLTAAALTGLVCVLSQQQPIRRVRVVAEGGLFNSCLDSQTRYASIVKTTCKTLFENLGLPEVKMIFSRIRNANLVGTAIAALC